jgi:hypothetical protein
MSVSRDFIDSYSPEVLTVPPATGGASAPRNAAACEPYCRAITLVFGFHIGEDLLKALISLARVGGFPLFWAKKESPRAAGAVDGLVQRPDLSTSMAG